MVDCKKCLHAPVCEKLPKMPGAIIAECEDFKDRTKWVERPKGRWKYFHKQNIAVCTNCSFERDLDANFGRAISCPNCGADMRGESE